MSDFNSDLDDNNGGNNPNIIESLLRDFLPYWPVIFAAAIIGFISSKVYLRYKRPVHQSVAGILLKNESESTESLLKQAVGKQETKVEDELEILKGSNVMQRAAILVNALYTIEFAGQFNNFTSHRNSQPFDIDFLEPDSIKPFRCKINVNKLNTGIVLNSHILVPYNQIFSVYGNEIVVKSKPADKGILYNFQNYKKIELIVRDKVETGAILSSAFNITKNKNNSTINLTLNSDKLERCQEWLNAIIQSYQIENQNEKRKRAKFTMDFIDDRLAYLGQDLDSVESNLENFKKQNDIQRVSAEAGLYLDKVKSGDKLAAETDLQLLVLGEIEKYVQGRIKKPGMVPSMIGLGDANLTSYFEKLNEAESKLDQLVDQNGVENDAVKSLKKQIKTYKDALLEIIANTRTNLNLLKRKAEQDFTKYNGQYDDMMRSIPSKERKLLNITRQQNIKNALYTFLLERREESAIQQAGQFSDVRIVQAPTYVGIVSPKTFNVQTLFTLGFLIFVLIILFIKSWLNNKISGRSDIESRTKVPVLAEIVQVESDNPLIMKDGNRSLIAEQIRGLRTNLSYFLDAEGKSKLLVSSSIPGEGKSFMASNIAIGYALAGKRTVLIESDLRKPNVAKHFKIARRTGLSVYLTGNTGKDEVIFTTEFENLFVIPSGPIPPNPVELILNGRYEKLLEELGREYDHVIIDCPPIGLVTDAQVIGQWVDAAILVVRHQHTPKVAVEQLIEKLREDKKFKQMGLVFNGLKGGISGYGYGYSYGKKYGYGYGSYGYGTYGGGSGYGYYGSEKKQSRNILQLAYNLVVVPFLAFFGRRKS
jgi:capsular exopolysaccharide synthesis family protein